jgi:hypothetical protein
MSQLGLQKAHTAIAPKLTPEPPPGFFVNEENVGAVMAHTTAVGADEIDHQHSGSGRQLRLPQCSVAARLEKEVIRSTRFVAVLKLPARCPTCLESLRWAAC